MWGTICSLVQAKIKSHPLFRNLTPGTKSIVTKSRKHTFRDIKSIESEVQQLLLVEIMKREKASPVIGYNE